VKGYGVVETGWVRSPLMQPTIEIAKSSNTLNKLTFVLLYATDFADRLEKEIIPGAEGWLRRVVRPLHLHRARAGGRTWRRPAVACAICTALPSPPHMVFYLNIDVKTLIGRILAARGMDLLGIGDGPETRRRHLRQLPYLSEQAACASTPRWRTNSTFRVVDARRTVDRIQDELRKQVSTFLEPADQPAEPALTR
jgi:dTMP kinase